MKHEDIDMKDLIDLAESDNPAAPVARAYLRDIVDGDVEFENPEQTEQGEQQLQVAD